MTVKILPEFLKAYKGQSIYIEISAGSFSLDSSISITNEHLFTLRNINSKYVFIKIYAVIKLADNTKKYMWTGDRISFENGKIINRQITFPEDCAVNKYFGGKTCPRCNRSDKVIPIISGLPSPNLPGEVGVDYELGSCIRTPCDPSWFCKKDNLHF
ncbi:MAG TPA: hypothetical protein VFZ47_08290 [Chitinophagaceae bacterium]